MTEEAARDSVKVLRELEPADLAALVAAQGAKGVKSLPIKKLRDSHHNLAMILASGVTDGEAAERAGYTLSRVSILKNDPMFAELISHYREIRAVAFADAQAKMASLLTDTLDELRERVEEEPETLSPALLLSIVEKLADRTGNGPKSTTVNVNVNLAARLGEARRRTAEMPAEGRAAEPSRLLEMAPEGRAAGKNIPFSPLSPFRPLGPIIDIDESAA